MKVFMKCVNIKLWDILGCFHYILNAPRIFYGDLAYKLKKKNVGKPNLNDKFKKITKRCKKLDIT